MKVNKKNILFISNLYPFPWHAERGLFNKQQLDRLEKHHNIKYIISLPWTDYIKNYCKFSGSYFIYLYPPRMLRGMYSLFYFVSLFMQRFLSIYKFRPDVIFSTWSHPDSVAAYLVAILLKKPLIVKVHGNDVNVSMKNDFIRRQVVYIMNKSASVITVSKDLKNKLIAYGVNEEVINVIYNGVDKDIFKVIEKKPLKKKLGMGLNRKIILFVGNLKKSKGVNLLVSTYLNNVLNFNSIDLHVIGDGEEYSNLKAQIESFNASDRVILHGKLKVDEVIKYYNTADVLCLPSDNEGVPNVILEAMSCGLPCVATAVGGIPEIVNEENGIIIEDHNELLSALQLALSRQWDTDKIVAESHKYDWNNNINSLLKLI